MPSDAHLWHYSAHKAVYILQIHYKKTWDVALDIMSPSFSVKCKLATPKAQCKLSFDIVSLIKF
jgi:hypothetical protein